jgi:acyl-CoA synthetase (NDP forming)
VDLSDPVDGGWIEAALRPRSIAIVGASADPEKIGGRPIKYMLREGYRGELFPVNAQRDQVQGLKAYRDVASLPHGPDLAVIAVPGLAAVDAVKQCAAIGTKVAVVMTSGFGETGEAGRRAQADMVAAARAGGMRLVGPNTQGIANFSTGAVATFATLIGEVAPQDGPVAIVSQSGAMSVVPYAFLRARGIGVRHSHATGNESDLTVADFARAVAIDPEVKLILLYLEAIADPAGLRAAAETARRHGVPIVALKAGVSERGQAAASSHTGALATEDRVVDAFFEQLGIWRVPDMRSLCNAAELYLRGWQPTGRRVVAISNSGASCVMAADAAERFGAELDPLEENVQQQLQQVLPGFAACANPIDLTAALLTNSSLFGAVLPPLADAADGFFVSLPMSGKGYDVPRFARDAAQFVAKTGKPLVLASPLASTREVFRAEGVVTFEHDVDAVSALTQFLRHGLLLQQPAAPEPDLRVPLPSGEGFLSEAKSLALLASAGVPVVPHAECGSPEAAADAFEAMEGPVVVKGCSPDVPHKSEHGLVLMRLASAATVKAAAEAMLHKLAVLEARDPSVIVARQLQPARELVVGARWMEGYGALVMVGDGGKYVEALKDIVFLAYPFDEAFVREKLQRLRIAPVLRGVRGEPPVDLAPVCRMAVALGSLVAGARGRIASVDLNPVFVGPRPEDTVVGDALVELAAEGSP